MVVVLTQSVSVRHEQQVVQSDGTDWWATGIRVQLNVTKPNQWLLWAFPNTDALRMPWEFVPCVNPVKAFDLADMVVAEAEPVYEWVRPSSVLFASDFNDLVRVVPWDSVEDRRPQFNDDLLRVQKAYGEHYAFCAIQIDRSGPYEFQWRWSGSHPFACVAWMDERPSERTTVTMVGATHIEWIDPGLGDPGPQRQWQRRSPAVFAVAELIPREKCRNSDLAARIDARVKIKPTNCVLM